MWTLAIAQECCTLYQYRLCIIVNFALLFSSFLLINLDFVFRLDFIYSATPLALPVPYANVKLQIKCIETPCPTSVLRANQIYYVLSFIFNELCALAANWVFPVLFGTDWRVIQNIVLSYRTKFDLTYVDGFAPDVIQVNDWLFFNFCPLVIDAYVP